MLTWVLVVFVYADPVWREWRTYTRLEECREAAATITHHRETVLEARCEPRWVKAP